MSSIRFNQMTKEITIEGSESFVESNFGKVKDLLFESLGVKKQRESLKTSRAAKRLQPIETPEQLIPNEIIVSEESATAEDVSTKESTIPEDLEGVKTSSLPIQECILREDGPSNRDNVCSSTKEMPARLSLASLKEKFGLTESQIERIIADAEKQGRIRKDMDGTYVWV